MADIHGRLGAVAPGANTDTTLYIGVDGTNTRATGKVVLCNRGTSDTTFRLFYVDGGTVANEDYLYYDAPLPANGTIVEERIPVGAYPNSLSVRFGSANCSAVFLGVQEDI